MAMGLMGLIVVTRRVRGLSRRRDFAFVLNAYTSTRSFHAKVNTMLDFNLWTWNSRAFPGIRSLVCSPPTPSMPFGYEHAVPVDRRVLRQLVGDEDAHAIALDALERRAGLWPL